MQRRTVGASEQSTFSAVTTHAETENAKVFYKLKL